MGNLVKFDGSDSSGALTRQGVSAVGFLATGAGFFVMGTLPALLGIVIGAVACFIGAGSVFSGDKSDRVGGTVLFAGGALTLLAKFRIPLLAGISQTALIIGGFVCLGLGFWKGLKFLRGLKNRM
jgi:hypothetical protein